MENGGVLLGLSSGEMTEHNLWQYIAIETNLYLCEMKMNYLD